MITEKEYASSVALPNIILRGVVGSTTHGMAIEGTDDRDEMGIFVEPAMNVCGLRRVDHYIQRDRAEGERSQPGDLDLSLYSLRRFCQLAVTGNPSVLLLLWLPNYMVASPIGVELVKMQQAFVSKEAGKAFLGYLIAQRQKLTGDRARNVNRPELVEKYGYDTKFASHALRLGYEGIEFLTDRHLTLPVAEPKLTTLRAIKTGQITLQETLTLINEAEVKLTKLVNDCTWSVDVNRVNQFLVKSHHTYWGVSDTHF